MGSGLIVKDYLDAPGFTKARTLQSENQILHTYGVQNKILNPEATQQVAYKSHESETYSLHGRAIVRSPVGRGTCP